MENSASLNITADEFAIINKYLQKYVPNREVWAFGSRVTGKARQYSDLDLAIIGDEPILSSSYYDLKEELAESDLRFRVDVVDWATTSLSFRKIIAANKVVVSVPSEYLSSTSHSKFLS